MQNQEYLLTVLRFLREGKKINEIAEVTHRHRNTVSRYVKWLKINVAHDLNLVTNEVLDELQTRIIYMNNRDLIAFFGKLYAPPQKAEIIATEEIREEISFKFDELSEDEREFCRRIARNYIKRNDKTRSASIH